jgi:hypothetical protein
MNGRIRGHRPSPAMMVAILALFVALGGTSYAAVTLGKNSVGSKQLKKNSVTAEKIKKDSIPGNRVKSNSLSGRQINESSLTMVPLAAQAEELGGINSAGFIQGTGKAFANRASVEVADVVDPEKVTQPLGSIAGLGTFALVGSLARPGSDCLITFTNESGGPISLNGDANPGLADGGTTEITGADARPEGDSATFTLLTQDAADIVSGQTAITFGFPSANTMCAGAVTGLSNN